MPRGKDSKVWNEDLVTALRSREELCRQRFSQRQYLWRDGAAAIASVRKDIFQFKTGRIVGLPRTLTKYVEEECRAIIEGKRPLLPEGYIPTTLEEKNMSRAFDVTERLNPYHDDPYLKRIKMRGGAYAILMAFHFSEAKTMTQKQICSAAQNFCDEEMEPNFYSGRSYGAWSSKTTLLKHGLIKESRTTQMGRQGRVCNGVFEYALTDDGKLFVEALLRKFPQASTERNHSCAQKENQKSETSLRTNECITKKESSTKPLKIKSENTYNTRKCLQGKSDYVSKNSKPKKDTRIENLISLSDSENDDDSFFQRYHDSRIFSLRKQRDPTQFSDNTSNNVIDLVDSDEESSSSELNESDRQVNTKKSIDFLRSFEKKSTKRHAPMIKKKLSGPKLTILIDNRERNHNATPRYMRIEFSRHISETSGSLQKVWPSHMPVGEVQESQLNYGDFAFLLKHEQSNESQRLPVTIERKRISDLVQRSSRAHHWQQLHRMRDCCKHAILLVEGNTKKISNFLSYDEAEGEESWNPDRHTIDDEGAFYRFLGRAILSSAAFKVLQAKDEQATYRSIGATGLVASLATWEKEAPRSVPTTKVALNKLYNKLKSRGIPWQIARRISEELGSTQQLNAIYEHCEASARPSVLVPAIREACSSMIEAENSRSLLEYGTVEAWSSAIHSAWYSKIKEPTEVTAPYEEHKYFANDRAQFLKALHSGKSVERSIKESNAADEASLIDPKCSMRRVRIECSSNFSTIFPSHVDDEAFYEILSVEENPLGLVLPSVVMQTNDGTFQSSKLVACVIEGNDLIGRIEDITERQSKNDFVAVSKVVAEEVNSECSSFLICPKKDRRVLLIRGLGSAMNAAAKKANYLAESRVLVDLAIAELMLRYNVVVIHAPRLVSDLEMILREFAMACFYYQLTTYKLR
jgi:ERCC4-type nuclease